MGKRIAALAAALLMIGAALAWRYRGASSQQAERPESNVSQNQVDSVICPSDFIDACRRAAVGKDINVELQAVSTTLDASTLDSAWVTLAGLPEGAAFAQTTELDQTPVATSPLELVVLGDRASALTATCGAPVDWVCLGSTAGTDWSDVGGDASWGTVRPGLSPPDSAIGAISITAAIGAYFDGRSIDVADASFISWARQFARTVPPSGLSAGTAVQTIQVRSSTLDIAAGAAAEVSESNRGRFADVTVGDDANATVVVVSSRGNKVSDDFIDALRVDLTNSGWSAATTASAPIISGQVRAAIAAWEDMQ